MEKITYRGHVITIERDNHRESCEFDHPNSYGRGVWDHGPSAECSDPSDCWQWISIWLKGYEHGNLDAGFEGPDEFREYFNGEEWIVLPVRGYSHSGWAFSTGSSGQFSCPWDSGFAGMVAIRKDLPKGLDKTPHEYADSTVAQFEAWFNGEYYGYSVEGPSSDDSCWGYLCVDYNTDHLVEDAKSNIDASIAYDRKQWFNRLKDLIRNNAPLSIRNQEVPYERLAL